MKTSNLVVAVLLVVPSLVRAETETVFDAYRLSVSVGAGVTGFVESTARDHATEGGAWDTRVGFNTTGNLAVEAAYVGSLQSIDALGLSGNARLLGTGVEANIRLNFMTGSVQPYTFVGGGWLRYDVSATTNTSTIAGYDNVATLPMGLGVGYRIEDIVLDLRGTYRATSGASMMAPTVSNGRLDSWTATLRAGFEF